MDETMHDDRSRWTLTADALPLARSSMARGASWRDRPHLIEDLRALDDTNVLLVHRGLVAVRPAMTPGSEARDELELVAATALDDVGLWVFLGADGNDGVDAGELAAGDVVPGKTVAAREVAARAAQDALPTGAYLALILSDEAVVETLVEARRWRNIRDMGEGLSARDAGLATAAVALAQWHGSHQYCSRCGAAMEVVSAGWVRRCSQDASLHYPRTDPAVIMAVVDAEDRLLLGSSRQWPATRFSTLAGYVEPGEPVEQTVRREVAEEVGLVIADVEFLGSQPWPFPASMMLAFRAHAVTTDIEVDGAEVTAARWFSREELSTAVKAGEVDPPMPASIARAMIEQWFGGPLPTPTA